ncbi:unnamed protein product, partial [Discosporangium mesarthrocarpum]
GLIYFSKLPGQIPRESIVVNCGLTLQQLHSKVPCHMAMESLEALFIRFLSYLVSAAVYSLVWSFSSSAFPAIGTDNKGSQQHPNKLMGGVYGVQLKEGKKKSDDTSQTRPSTPVDVGICQQSGGSGEYGKTPTRGRDGASGTSTQVFLRRGGGGTPEKRCQLDETKEGVQHGEGTETRIDSQAIACSIDVQMTTDGTTTGGREEDNQSCDPKKRDTFRRANSLANVMSVSATGVRDVGVDAVGTLRGRFRRADSTMVQVNSNPNPNPSPHQSAEKTRQHMQERKKGEEANKRDMEILCQGHPSFFEVCVEDMAVSRKHLGLRTKKTNASTGTVPLPSIAVRHRFASLELLTRREVSTLISEATKLLDTEPNVLKLSASRESPVLVVGDIHGQYSDLLAMMDEVMDDLKANMQKGSFLFLGDYVDRGPCSCEVMLLLLALKVEAPNCVHLLRGNHESSNQTRVYGFKTECSRKYGEAVYDQFMHCFQSLPLAAVVSGPKHGNTDTRGMSGNDRTADSCQDNPTRYFCVHGGLSPKLMTLGDIEALERREEPSRDSALADLLWSDPSDDPGVLDANVKRRAQAIEGSDDEESQFDENGFDVNPLRGLSYTFGASAAKDFLLENHLDHLLRAHSVQDKGFFQHFANSPYQLHPKNVQTTPNLASAPRQSHSDMESCSQLTQESNFMGVPSQGTSELEGNQEYDPNPNTCSSSRVSLAMVSTVFSAPKYGGRRKNRG